MKVIKEFKGNYRFLSNFEPCVVLFDGFICKTVEHAFQASKTFEASERYRIFEAKSPSEAKKLGRSATLRPDWEEVKDELMESLVRKKFNHSDLKERLLATGDKKLVEGNTWGDTYWGVDVRTGKGKNKLGKILMKIRKELQKEAK